MRGDSQLTRNKLLTMAFGSCSVMAAGFVFAATLKAETPSVVVMAGQTVEVPLSSDLPISGDLAARGAFESGEITFTSGPGCSRSANGCTLVITASPTSKSYTTVPVVVSASRATNTGVFSLSVIRPGESAPANTEPPKIVLTADKLSGSRSSESRVAASIEESPSVETRSEESIQRSGNSLFYAEAVRRPRRNTSEKNISYFTAETNGPAYQIVAVKNYAGAQSLSVSLTGSGANYFTIDNTAAHYGVNRNCASMTKIASGDSCILIIKGKVGDPSKRPETARLTIRGNNRSLSQFILTTTTYVYAAGGFNTLGNASVSGGDLLAQCTAGTCSNALQGTTGNNYSSTSFSVGQWINALAVTPAGNIMVGGVFGEIGGATSGASSGTAALLAQCTPGPVTGNACINHITTGNPYAFNNAYINGVTEPTLISGTNYMIIGGDFNAMRASSANGGGRMLAKCLYNDTSSTPTCNHYMAATKYGNNTIVAVDTLNSTSGSPLVNVGGLFTQIAGYPASAPSSGTTFASCTSGAGATCSKGMDTNNPNGSILGMANDGTNLYMGGTFTQIGGYTDSNGGFPLVSCIPAVTTTCSNGLAASNDANGHIEGLAYSGGNLYVGGKFTTIGGATPVASGYMLAVCTPGGTCANVVTDANPYSTGSDWNGVISAVAIGNQTSILAY